MALSKSYSCSMFLIEIANLCILHAATNILWKKLALDIGT